jgi:hypothetical protein
MPLALHKSVLSRPHTRAIYKLTHRALPLDIDAANTHTRCGDDEQGARWVTRLPGEMVGDGVSAAAAVTAALDIDVAGSNFQIEDPQCWFDDDKVNTVVFCGDAISLYYAILRDKMLEAARL